MESIYATKHDQHTEPTVPMRVHALCTREAKLINPPPNQTQMHAVTGRTLAYDKELCCVARASAESRLALRRALRGAAVSGVVARPLWALEQLLGGIGQGLDADELGEDALAARRQAVVEVDVQVRPLDTVDLLVELDRLGHVDRQLEAARVHEQPSAPDPLDRERVGVGRPAHDELDPIVRLGGVGNLARHGIDLLPVHDNLHMPEVLLV